MGLRCRCWLTSDRSPAAVGNTSLVQLLSRNRPSMLKVLRGIIETRHGCTLSPWKLGNNTNRLSSIRSGADASNCRLEEEMRRRWWPERSSLRKRPLHRYACLEKHSGSMLRRTISSTRRVASSNVGIFSHLYDQMPDTVGSGYHSIQRCAS